MSESVIISSPTKSNDSIRATKRKKRYKQLKVDRSVEISSEQIQSPVSFHNLLKEFYKNSEDETTGNSKSLLEKPAILKNYKPFEGEKSLAMADHLFVQQINQNTTNICPDTQGFIICKNLPNTNTILESSEKHLKNDSFGITESELINCCHQVEKVLENAVPETQDSKLLLLTPKKSNMLLVNSILEDFSQSPLSNDDILPKISFEYTPEFRLRKLPVRTYSHKYLKSKRTNLVKRFENPDTRYSSELDDNISCCSSLSIQEDDTFCEVSNNQLVVTSLNNTGRLCENLLNLTEYYTQNEFNQSFIDDEEYKNDLYSANKISDLMDEILTFRSKHSNELIDDSYNSSDDFKGFLNSNNNGDTKYIDQKNPIKNGNDLASNNSSVPSVRGSNILKDKEADWNDDDCNDIFACINTENVMEQTTKKSTKNDNKNVEVDSFTPKSTSCDETFIIQNKPNSTTCNFVGFRTASSKPIKVSRKAHIVAAQILSHLPEIPGFAESASLKNCDKDENEFENPDDYEWNDDCDFFTNFQTPISLKETTEANMQQYPSALLESTTDDQEAPSNSKILKFGYTTAAGKNIPITSKGKATVQSLLNEIDVEINNKNYKEKLKDLKFKVYAKTHNLKTVPSTLGDIKLCGKDGELHTAKENVKEILMTTKNTENVLNAFYVASENNNMSDLEALNIDFKPKASQDQTSSFNIENQQKTGTNNHPNIYNNSFKKIMHKCTATPNENLAEVVSYENENTNIYNLNSNINIGFQTANGKQVLISEKAKQTVKTILKEFNTDLDVETCEKDLKDLKTKILNKNGNLKQKVVNENFIYQNSNENKLTEHDLKRRGDQLNENSAEMLAFEKPNINVDQYLISENPEHIDENLLKEFNAVLDAETCVNKLEGCSPKQSDNRTPKLTISKRKISADSSDSETPIKQQPEKLFKNDLQSSKSSLAEQSLKSPLITVTRSLIARKNLLSLTIKRKNKRNKLIKPTDEICEVNNNLNDLNSNVKTPIKSKLPAPETPNLEKFLTNASLTSTPRNHKPISLLHSFGDSDLKPIIWKNDSFNNKSASNSLNTSNNSSANISFNSPNPTAKERIGRLKMYGKAPDVSPIFIETNHNCRPSGLRRTRSMLEKS